MTTTADLLTRRLELAYRWYQGMVDPATGRLAYLYLPASDTFVRERCPIRDIASVWDVELLGAFLHRADLHGVVRHSLEHYVGYLARRDGALILDADRLREPSSIAHSAFLLLALVHAPPPRRDAHIRALADGILHQQRTDGSYKVYFDDVPDSGEELYAGEAMLALLEAHRQSADARYVASVARGAAYYDAGYYRRGRVADDAAVFFANWQSQACRLLYEETREPARAREIAEHLYRMHDRIVARGFFADVEQHPTRQVSVEVACALEGLNDAYAVARVAGDDARGDRYRGCICTGLGYLLALQCTHDGTERERGGFGLTRDDRSQRIDVTGHAASALMKSVENGIVCPPFSA